MKKPTLSTTLLFIIIMMGTTNAQPLETVSEVNLAKYAGRWFEIASYPASFQKGCRCTTAEYEYTPGTSFVRVINRCIRFKNGQSKISGIKGKAFPVEGSKNARLKVQFFWPFRGDYYVIGLADDYNWAIVGHPKRKYLWVLSRDSFMTTDTWNTIIKIIEKKGYDVNRLVKTPQNCDSAE